jgi:hypothetical protein
VYNDCAVQTYVITNKHQVLAILQVQTVKCWSHDCQKVFSPADDVEASGYNTVMIDAISFLILGDRWIAFTRASRA